MSVFSNISTIDRLEVTYSSDLMVLAKRRMNLSTLQEMHPK